VTAQLGMRLDALLGSVATTEARLAVTAGILLVTLAVGWLLLPRGVRAAERVVTHWLERFLDGRAESSIETLQEAVPVSFGLRLFVGLLQLVLFVRDCGRCNLGVVGAVRGRGRGASGRGERAHYRRTGAPLRGASRRRLRRERVLEEYVEDLSADSDRITAHQEQLLSRIMQVGVLVIAGITVLGIWGVNLGGLLVGAGFLGSCSGWRPARRSDR